MSDNRGSLAPNRQVGRFTLTDLVEERYGCQVWRGADSTLNREVALWLVPYAEDLAGDLRMSTKTAATVDDRRIVRILDVFREDDLLVIVTEWAAGAVLRDHLAEPLAPRESARIAYELAGAIESAHAKGIAHGRIHPTNVLVCGDGEVRLTGLGIDAVLAGIEPIAHEDPIRADINGIGSILYSSLTARWPDGDVDGVPGAPPVAGRAPAASRLVADIPEPLDDLSTRCVIAVEDPKGRPGPRSAAQVRGMLADILTDMTAQRRPYMRASAQRRSTWPKVLGLVGALVVAVGLGWLGWRVLGQEPALTAPATPTPTAEPSSEPSASASATPPSSVTYPIVAGTDFDPLGNGEESPGRVPAAFDGDLKTSWRTVTYYNKSLDKPGVGLLLDLGAPRPIGRVNLNLVGNGTDLQVLTSNDPGRNPQDYTLVAQATEAGEKVTLKVARPSSARYVLVWLTGLPQVDGGWRGGIREISVGS